MSQNKPAPLQRAERLITLNARTIFILTFNERSKGNESRTPADKSCDSARPRPNKSYEMIGNAGRSSNRRPDGNTKSASTVRAVKVNLLVANSPKNLHTLSNWGPPARDAWRHIHDAAAVTRATGWCRCRLLHGAAPFSAVTALHRRPNDTLLKEVQFCMALITLSHPARRSKAQTPSRLIVAAVSCRRFRFAAGCIPEVQPCTTLPSAPVSRSKAAC